MAKKNTDTAQLPRKMLVTVDELSELTNIGVNHLREQILNDKTIEDEVVLHIGKKMLIKVDAFHALVSSRKYL